MIIFTPEGKTTGVVYAFTDVDCGYCRRLHQEIPALNAKGIELRYLAFPRGGKDAPLLRKNGIRMVCFEPKRRNV